MFYNLSKTNLIKRFHYMLTMLKVRSIIQKIKSCSVQCKGTTNFLFFSETAKSLAF